MIGVAVIAIVVSEHIKVLQDCLNLSLVGISYESILVEVIERGYEILIGILFPFVSLDVGEWCASVLSQQLFWDVPSGHVSNIISKRRVVSASDILSVLIVVHVGNVVLFDPLRDRLWRSWSTVRIVGAFDLFSKEVTDAFTCVVSVVVASEVSDHSVGNGSVEVRFTVNGWVYVLAELGHHFSLRNIILQVNVEEIVDL